MLQRTDPERRVRDAEGVSDLLRWLGPVTADEVADRSVAGADVVEWLTALADARRAVAVRMGGDERWASIEDVGRLRDGLGVPVPPGVPDAFTEPVEDPLADLVSRYARTHGPFTVGDVSARLGLGAAVVRHTLQRLGAQGRVLEGEFRPAGSGAEWCDAEVLRLLRRRSLARLRREVEPVEPAALGRFLLAWQHVDRPRRGPRGLDGLLQVVDQLAGYAAPASAWESLILPSRVADYEPALLDELTASGEVMWVGHASLPGADGWVSLHLGDQAPLTMPLPPLDDTSPLGDLHQAIVDSLAPGGGWFFRQLQTATGGKDRELAEALWDLVWAGRVTNDTFAPLRALAGSGAGTHRTRRATPRARAIRAGVRPAPPTTSGRWAILPEVDPDPTRRAHATAEHMLERYGVVTRGSVMSERTAGGFAAVYKVLSAFEDSGRCRRGYFVEGLGAAQFGSAGAVDRLRTFSELASGSGEAGAKPTAITLAATDPANPFGAALPWPERETSGGHRPGRKAGALVVLVDGALTLYVERGGRTLLTWSDDAGLLGPAALGLSEAGRRGALGRITVEKADGEQILGGGSTPLREALDAAGFVSTPRGLRLRG
jgi:ATP-dependent Lhr-like helicase